METISLKALSRKVLNGNSQGNSLETDLKKQGNFGPEKKGKVSTEHGALINLQNVSTMSLEEFKRRDMVIPVDSSFLGEVVYFASHGMAARKRGELAGPVYTASELQCLPLGIDKDDLKVLNEAKKVFGGRIIND